MNRLDHDPDRGTDGERAGDAAMLRGAFTTLLDAEPPLRHSLEDFESAGVRLRRDQALARRRRLGAGAGLLVAASAATWSATGQLRTPASPSVAIATRTPPATATVDPAGGTMLARGFPLAQAFGTVSQALPDGVVLGDAPPDAAWEPGPRLAVPLVHGSAKGTSVLTLGPTCRATAVAGVLDAAAAQHVADAVCAAWREAGSPDVNAPVPTPSGSIDPASLAAQ